MPGLIHKILCNSWFQINFFCYFRDLWFTLKVIDMFKPVYGKQKLKRNFTQLSKCLGYFSVNGKLFQQSIFFICLLFWFKRKALFFCFLFCSSIETTICVAYNFTAKISFKFVLTKQFHISFAMLFYYIYIDRCIIYNYIVFSFSAEDKLKNNFLNLESLCI